MNETLNGMRINRFRHDLDVIIYHPAGVTPRQAHENARAVKGVRIVDTFRTGWGALVTMGIQHGSVS